MTSLQNAVRVRVERDVNLMPHTVLMKGEEGTIVHVETDALGVWAVHVKMDKIHRGLAEWNNEAYLVDPELQSLVPVSAEIRPFRRLVESVAAGVSLLWPLKEARPKTRSGWPSPLKSAAATDVT